MVTDTARQRLATGLPGVLLSLACLLASGGAAEDPAAPANPEKILEAAFAKTKTAKTREAYEDILRMCDEAQQAPLSDRWKAYAEELRAWTHNRYGELFADEAASLAADEQTEQAEAADAKALAEFETAVKLNPKNWKAVHNRGVSYALVERFDEAIADFTRVLELKPDHANAWFNRGELHFELGEFEDALADYSETLRLKPSDYEAQMCRGETNFHLRRYGEALADFRRAAELAPTKVEAVICRGDAQVQLGQWRQAAEDYRKAITMDNQSGRAYQSTAWLMATCPESRYRNDKLAIQAAERAIRLDGDEDFRYLDTLAAAYANAGDFEKAAAAVEKALERAPVGSADTLQQRLGLYKKGQPYRQRVEADGETGT